MVLSIMEARSKLADTVNRVQYGGERIVLERHGKGVAAVVSIEDLQLLNQLEDQSDAKAVKRARKAIASGKIKPIPWKQVKSELEHRWNGK